MIYVTSSLRRTTPALLLFLRKSALRYADFIIRLPVLLNSHAEPLIKAPRHFCR